MRIQNYVTGPIQVNTYLCYDEVNKKGFLVDPGDYKEKIAERIKELDLDLEYIILTHGHGDHIGGVERFKKEFPNAKVLACKYEDMLLDANLNSSIGIFGRPIVINADVLVDDFDTLKIGDMDLLFIHTPGHTLGGMCILVDKYLFSGDTLFRYSVGRTDFYGGSFPQLKASIEKKLFTLDDDVQVLPGHEEFSLIGDEKEGNPYVRC